MTLLAYHSDPAIKRRYVQRVEDHRKADELIQGATEGRCDDGTFRGCAVACTFEVYDHNRGPGEIGVTVELMHLNDAIFEGLPEDDALKWPTQFLQAIPVGAELSLVFARFAVWNLTDEKWGATALPHRSQEALDCCRRVAALWQRVIDGESQAGLRIEFKKEEALARAGAGVGVEAVAWAWAEAVAWAWAGAWAVARAGAGAGAVARADYWNACADKLAELLKDAPVMKP